MGTAALFRLEEISSEVFAVDTAGNSKDLGDDPSSSPALAMPSTAVSFTGRGRSFGDDIGLQGLEEVADSLRLTRDFTVRAIVRYRIDNASNGEKATIVARGRRGSAAERLLFAVEIERVDASTAKLLARWEEVGGAAAGGIAGAEFVPDPDQFFTLAVVRRWIDSSTVELSYTVNEIEIGTETVTAGDIGEGSGGTLTIGCVGDGAGAYERFMPEDSVIDQVSIESDAMCFEEIRQEFRRITVHQPNGYRILRSYFPPGDSWNKDPASAIQRWIAAEGDTLGFALAQAAKLREDHLPDRAYGEALEAWETLLKISPKPLDTIQDRRDEVIAALRKILGFAIEDLKTALEPLFGLTAAEIEILEFSVIRSDDFSTDDITPATPSNMWRDWTGNGSLAVAGGVCSANIPGGTPNCQWVTDPNGSGAPPYRETSIAAQFGDDPTGAVIVIDVDATISPGVDVLSGVFMRNAAGDVIFFGVLDAGGGFELQSYTIVDGVRSALTSHGVGGAGVDRVFLRSTGSAQYEVGRVSGGVATVLATGLSGPSAPRWAGFGSFSRDAASDAQDADFDDAEIFEPDSPRGFAYLAYRDPGLGGTYNLDKAQAQLDKQSPAHTVALAVDEDPHFMKLGDDGRLGVDFLMPRIP